MSCDNSRRRYLGLWVPFLPADRWQREQTLRAVDHAGAAGDDHAFLAFVEKDRGDERLAAISAAAWANGLRPGLSLADARARYPSLRAVALDSGLDRAFLEHLTEFATTFTPSVALDEPNGLVLDITGCAHLFGGEIELAQRLAGALRSAGITVCRLAVAPTPEMARALARFAPKSPCFAEDNTLVRALPVAALECASEDAVALRRAGLKTIADIADRPSVLFTARFSQDFTVKLARVLGEEDRRITPLRLLPACQAEHRCAEPVVSREVIEKLLYVLAATISEQLRARGEGGRLFESSFLRTDGAICRVRIETSLPTRDPAVFMRLHRDRLNALSDPLDPGFGFDLIRLKVLHSELYEETQATLNTHEDSREQVSQLIDRLSATFGRDRVTRLKPCDTHIPERAQIVVPAADGVKRAAWPTCAQFDRPRPLFLYRRPHSVETAADECGKPCSFRWRRRVHQIIHADGPERIADEWWRAPSGYGIFDYYRVESAEGRRFWLFRANATINAAPPKWFLHGIFP